MSKVLASKTLTVKAEGPGGHITFGDLKGLVNLAAADGGFTDNSLVICPQAVTGISQISVREGEV